MTLAPLKSQKHPTVSARKPTWTPKQTSSAFTSEDVSEVRQSRGDLLTPRLRARAAATFGSNFDSVRIHTSDVASRAAARVSAHAFTVGENLYFGEGAYQPENNRGLRRIGHELAHVVQQRGEVHGGTFESAHERYEQQAEGAADSFVSGKRAHITRASRIGQHEMGKSFDGFHANAGSMPLQREKKHEDTPADPYISSSVGRKGENKPEDVKTVQRMLGLKQTSVADEALFKTIESFQSEVVGMKKPDGTIELPTPDGSGGQGMTWKELFKRETGRYPDSAPASTSTTSRPLFAQTANIMFGSDNAGAAVSLDDKEHDGNADGLDDATTNMREAADKAGVKRYEVGGASEATSVLEKYYAAKTSIETLLISGHGARARNNFWLGNDDITSGNVQTKLSPWRPYLNDNTNVLLKTCNTGGGNHPDAGAKLTQKIALTLGTAVLTSRSWAISKADGFNDQSASWYGSPKDWDKNDVKKYPEIYRNMGLWLKAMPPEVARKRAAQIAEFMAGHGVDFDVDAYVEMLETPQEINAPILHEDGSFTISDERFPTLSAEDAEAFQNYDWPDR